MKTGFWGITPELDTLMENRIFGKNTVDAVIQDSPVLLAQGTNSFLYREPNVFRFQFDAYTQRRIILTTIAKSLVDNGMDEMHKIHKVTFFTSKMAELFPLPHEANELAYPSPDAYFWGGTEEMLITKGTDWCGEVARVFCALTQALRIPSRIVYTFGDTDGHVLNECFVNNQWVLVDPTNNIIYQAEGCYYSAWNVISSLDEFERLFGNNKAYYCAPEYFKYVAVSEYMLVEAEKYSYRIAFCNDYYRKALNNVWNTM